MGHSSFLRSPKKEEQEVPDTNFTLLSDTNHVYADKKNDIMDELEGILGIEDEENLLPEGNMCGHLNWDFMDWEGFSVGEEEEEEEEGDQKVANVTGPFQEESHYYYSIKKENCGFWDEFDEQKRVSLNLSLNTDENWFPDNSSCKDITRPVQNDTRYNKARVFSNLLGKKWCYNLKTTKDQDYLIRGTFLSGEQQATVLGSFGVSVDATWISLVNSSDDTEVEGIFKATNEYTNFCLLKVKVDPYISKLELRHLNDSEYLIKEPSSVLKLVHRVDVGSSGAEIRYSFQAKLCVYIDTNPINIK